MHSSRLATTAALLALTLTLTACRSAAPRPPTAPTPSLGSAAVMSPAPLLLVSLDGFHPDYLTLGITPNLARIAAEGVRAQWMTPSYPALTFPNHYTLVTGLRPDRHGVVHNTMRDAQLGEFRLSDHAAVADAHWWGGAPLWVTAENAGLPTATMFWPGSSAAIAGRRPTRWQEFDAAVPIDTRVDTVLGWLGEDASTRPRLATLYLEHLDEASHDHGPGSAQARAVIVELDNAIGRLLDGLEARGLLDTVNVVVVSDHGMAAVAPGHVVAIEDMVDAADAQPVTTGQSVGFTPVPGRAAAAERQLLGAHARYDCWRKGELPARWQYGRHRRVPAIVCQMREGWDAATRADVAKWAKQASPMRGSHGFDPALPSMRALFIARGPALRQGVVLPAFDNVDVYPLLARLVGVEAAANDGDADALAALRASGL